eukprot:9034854-Pyramimonas_sp.AAC.1
MLDLWAVDHRTLRSRGGTVEVRWTKGHPTPSQIFHMCMTPEEVYIHRAADCFAGKAADAGQ